MESNLALERSRTCVVKAYQLRGQGKYLEALQQVDESIELMEKRCQYKHGRPQFGTCCARRFKVCPAPRGSRPNDVRQMYLHLRLGKDMPTLEPRAYMDLTAEPTQLSNREQLRAINNLSYCLDACRQPEAEKQFLQIAEQGRSCGVCQALD